MLYRDKFPIHRHKECCCGFLVGSSNWYLDVFEKLHKWLFRAVSLISTACLELVLEALCYIRITLELVLEALRFLRNTFEHFDLRLFLSILRLRFCFCCCFFLTRYMIFETILWNYRDLQTNNLFPAAASVFVWLT